MDTPGVVQPRVEPRAVRNRTRTFRILSLAAAGFVGAALTAGSASAATGNPWPYTMTDSNSDGLVIEGALGPNNNALLVRDNLGQPIFNVLEAGGASVMGDNFRVMAGDDIFNAVVTISPNGPPASCPKEGALWIGSGNVWKCLGGSWQPPRTPLW